MLKACKYCGRIHDSHYDCGQKPKRIIKKSTEATHLRSSGPWQKLREDIRRRDNNLCQLCLRNYSGTTRRYEYEDLSVHHIIPIEEDSSKAFDDDNLITVCGVHHEACESGLIDRNELKMIAIENRKQYDEG